MILKKQGMIFIPFPVNKNFPVVEDYIPLTSTKRFAFAIMLHVHAFHVLKEIFILKVTRSWIEQGKKEFKRKGDEDSRLKRKFRLI